MSVIDIEVEYNVITYNKHLIEIGKGQELIVNNPNVIKEIYDYFKGLIDTVVDNKRLFTIVDYIASDNVNEVVTIKCPYKGDVIVCQDLSCLKIEEQVHCYNTGTSLCYGNVRCLTGSVGKLYIIKGETK